MPTTPNIIHTMKHTVNDKVLTASTDHCRALPACVGSEAMMLPLVINHGSSLRAGRPPAHWPNSGRSGVLELAGLVRLGERVGMAASPAARPSSNG